MAEPPRAPGTVQPTSWQSVGVAFVVGAGVGWSVLTAIDRFVGDVPQVPPAVTAVVAVLAVVIGVEAWLTHRAIQVRRLPVPARRAVALVALGKACLLGGTALAGSYVAMTVYLARRLELNLPRDLLIGPVIAIVASLALAGAGAFLEHACRIPRPPENGATPSGILGSPDTAD